MRNKPIKTKSICKSPPQKNSKIHIENISNKEKKLLIDSLVDPAFVIANANSMLKQKLEAFVDSKTRENFYMIDRAQKKLVDTINQLRDIRDY